MRSGLSTTCGIDPQRAVWGRCAAANLEVHFYLFLGVAFPMALMSAPLALIAAVPLPLTAWLSWRLSVVLRADEVIIRNPLRTHRLRSITAAVPAENRGPRYSVGCIVFRDSEGRTVPAWAMSLFHASPANDRVTWCVTTWAHGYGSRHGVEVQLDPNYRDPEAVRRERDARVRSETSMVDPLESIGTVRKAFVGGLLYSIVTSPGGFKIVADSEDGVRSHEPVDYPTLDAAVAAARRLIADLIASPQADL